MFVYIQVLQSCKMLSTSPVAIFKNGVNAADDIIGVFVKCLDDGFLVTLLKFYDTYFWKGPEQFVLPAINYILPMISQKPPSTTKDDTKVKAEVVRVQTERQTNVDDIEYIFSQ